MSQHAFFQALPAYFGGKRRLARLIFSLLAEVSSRSEWPAQTFLDPFSGGGAISLYAKAQGFQVISADIAERSVIVARALIANSSRRLRQDDVLGLFLEPAADHPRPFAAHVPGVFTADAAAWLDRGLTQAASKAEPLRSLLLLLIIKLALRCQPMSMLRGTDARAAANGDFDRVSPRRLGHYLKARGLFSPESVWGIAQEINAGIFGGSGEARKGDAIEIFAKAAADIVYLDPPYPGTTSYEREYGVLDDAFGDGAITTPAPSLDALLTAAAAAPLLILSYGGPTLRLEELTELVGRHRPVLKAVAVPYAHLRSIAKRSPGENQEFIVIAG